NGDRISSAWGKGVNGTIPETACVPSNAFEEKKRLRLKHAGFDTCHKADIRLLSDIESTQCAH
ncbi:MAG TPA: hypothetical protein VLU47_10885, partial [Blastocatellia bacterium]|nr:hypothetical protein [Blastocatellia bacterium]